VEADFQITPMLTQELFGLVQGCILGRMRCPYGLTTNSPHHNELLCHLSFPKADENEPLDGAITAPNRDVGQRFASSSSSVFSCRSAQSGHKSKWPRGEELCGTIGQGESSEANLIPELYALAPL
jgi:hypothetical protein